MKTKKKSKSSAEYWREREEKQRKKNIKDEKEYSQEIDKIYRQMMDEIEVQINDFYTRYAGKEGITYAQAKERVSKLDIERYAELAKKYVAEKNFSKKANDEMRLYNLTMKVNRLELLKANIGMRIVGGFDELQQFFDEKLTERTLDTFERQAGILGKTVFDNQRYAHAIVNASFHNATWSDRIWTHQDVLRNELGSLLSTGLIQGRNPKELARTLRKKVESSKYNANRLMITEMARVQTEAQKQSYEKNGFTKYTFHSLGTACEHCLSINGKTFDLSDMQSGVNAPPMHPNCRCSTSAAIERTDFGVGNEEVADFDEWSETFDEHGLSWLDWLKKKERPEPKEYTPKNPPEIGELSLYPKKHHKPIKNLIEKMPLNIRHIWDDCVDLFHVDNPKFRGKGAAYYSGIDAVKMCMSAAAKGDSISKPYQNVFHEFGHHMDYILNRKYGNKDKLTAYSETYKNGIFGQTLKKEAERFLQEFADTHNLKARAEIESEFCKYVKKNLSLMERADISDMFEPVMKHNAFPFGAGHGLGYWKGRDNGKEAFAEMYAAIVANEESLDQIKKFFPESYKIFIEMIEDPYNE